MYRPEEWKNLYKGMGTVLDDNCEVIKLESTTAEHRAYEAGADAMLEGLKKRTLIELVLPTIFENIELEGVNLKGPGRVVFIPEGNEYPHRHVDGIVEDYPEEKE